MSAEHSRGPRPDTADASPRVPRTGEMPPVSLGRHQLLFPVGHGGMSDLYLALVTSAGAVNKLLVVKQLRASLLDEPEAASMFMDEARLAARLHHPNVVQTFEVGQEGPIPYMTMEFLDGQPLHRVLRRVGDRPPSASMTNGLIDRVLAEQPQTARAPLTLGMRLRIITEMLEALHYVHELRDYDGSPMQIVHRDISPQNLFITYEGQIKLVDFGIAKAADSITHTRDNNLKGKLAYMSPQQAAGESVDHRADLFAVGVMLWEMLSGRRLWAGHSEAVLSRRLVDGRLPPLALDFLPPALVEICTRALAPAPEARYASARDFLTALEQFMENAGFDASPRSIGKRVAQAFATERADMRARIDQELRRAAQGEVEGLPRPSLWRDGYRDAPAREHSELSEHSEHTQPEEVTADYGPKHEASAPDAARTSEHSAGHSESSAPAKEISGVIGVSRELPPAPPAMRSRGNAWRWATAGAALLVAGLALTALLRESAGSSAERGASQRSLAQPTDAAGPFPPPSSTSPPVPGTGDCERGDKLRVPLSGEIDEDATLYCDRDYLLSFNTRVAAGATLTIQAGTRVLGDRATKGTLIIEPGARLIAEGTPTHPIVFTSASPESERRPGDWGGLVVLGRAPLNLRDASGQPMRGEVEGLTGTLRYGGDDPEDDSGVLRYIRIEYPGVEIAPSNELNGLTLAGVGRGTSLDHIQVRAPLDDCFEFFGGTVDAKFLICDAPGDDALDFDHGYQGRIQHVVARDLRLGLARDAHPRNGLEFDNDPNGTQVEPRTRPQLWNATLCGTPGGRAPSHALLVRRAAQPRLGGLLISGYDYALDWRDASTTLELAGLALIAQAPAEANEQDDDEGRDELAWLADPQRSQLHTEQVIDCGTPATGLLPTAPIVAADTPAPPDDGFFDPGARHLGAFAGPEDDWTAPWARWSE